MLVGPLIDQPAFDAMQAALEAARLQGGRVHGGERVTEGVPPGGVLRAPGDRRDRARRADRAARRRSRPILYVMRYDTFDEAIAIHNGVPQGLSSAIFTTDMREAELFCSPPARDCGIANVNIGTSGAEIGALLISELGPFMVLVLFEDHDLDLFLYLDSRNAAPPAPGSADELRLEICSAFHAGNLIVTALWRFMGEGWAALGCLLRILAAAYRPHGPHWNGTEHIGPRSYRYAE